LDVDDNCWTKTVSQDITYSCTKSFSVAAQASPSAVTYDTTTSSWPLINLGSTGTTCEPGRCTYNWKVISKPSASTGTLIPITTGNTANFTPDTYGNYIVQFTVYDGCNVAAVNVSIDAVCPALVPGPGITLTNGANFVRTYAPVTVGLQAVTTYSFNWTVTNRLGQDVSVPAGSPTSFSATLPGTYSILLTEWNPACPNPATASTTITVDCNYTLGASVPNAAVTYTNSKFPRVQLAAAFTGENPNYPVGQFLTYSWWVVSAPTDSVYYPNTTSYTSTTTSNATSSIVKVGNLWYQWFNETTIETSTAVTTTTQLVYNDYADKVSACFYPDVAGQYSVELRVQDYCGEWQTASATVTANCNTAPSVTVNAPPTAVNWDGTGFVDYGGNRGYTKLVARAVVQDTDNVWYSWRLSAAPNGSALTDNSITNNRGSEASYVPDVPGDYTLELTVSDGCTEVVQTMSTTVGCVLAYTLEDPALTYNSDGVTPVNLITFTIATEPRCNHMTKLEIVGYDGNNGFAPAPAPPPPQDLKTLLLRKSDSP